MERINVSWNISHKALIAFVSNMPDSRNLHYAAHENIIGLKTKTSTYESLSFAHKNFEQFTVDHIQPLVDRGCALHCIALHYIALHCIALYYIALHYITLHYIVLHCIALHYITSHYISSHYISLHFIG